MLDRMKTSEETLQAGVKVAKGEGALRSTTHSSDSKNTAKNSLS